MFPVKGREIDAAILFADMTDFSGRTQHLSPTETLALVNNFFTWVTAEALARIPGIVDKYIGDEMMVIFSTEFGSADPTGDAVKVARMMAEHDPFWFCPHFGIAAGPITVGYVGTPLKYDCSAFGACVALAKRCASVKPAERCSCHIVLPSSDWGSRRIEDVLLPETRKTPDGPIITLDLHWRCLPKRLVQMKNLPDAEVIEIVNSTVTLPGITAEERAKLAVRELKNAGQYRPAGN